MLKSDNVVVGNSAAGSELLGFLLNGPPCTGNASESLIANNTAHSSVVGVLLQANTLSQGCTKLQGFTIYLNWDFGVVTMQGIPTNVSLQDVVVADNKFASG